MSLNEIDIDNHFDPAWVANANSIQNEIRARQLAKDEALKEVPEGYFFSESAVESIQRAKSLPQEQQLKISLN